MQMIQGENYTVSFDSASAAVVFCGALYLPGIEAYAPISAFLDEALAQTGSDLTLDLRELRVINSSGADMLFRFVLKQRASASSINLRVYGDSRHAWQTNVCHNMQRLLPTLQIDLA